MRQTKRVIHSTKITIEEITETELGTEPIELDRVRTGLNVAIRAVTIVGIISLGVLAVIISNPSSDLSKAVLDFGRASIETIGRIAGTLALK